LARGGTKGVKPVATENDYGCRKYKKCRNAVNRPEFRHACISLAIPYRDVLLIFDP
ncbi:11749_t:CDS:1, partial [Cetraspora pellucida]